MSEHNVQVYRLPGGGLMVAEEHTLTDEECARALCALAGRHPRAGTVWGSTTEGDRPPGG
ncbi:hypothetical protein OHV05_24510 [Kitasatospora sp. NBC_00070]|uniref:hypothetical protein n=1 Tax=Kitasatospora sp. NBC_00070 TaxID=2975962 RepID=UPI00324ED2F8